MGSRGDVEGQTDTAEFVLVRERLETAGCRRGRTKEDLRYDTKKGFGSRERDAEKEFQSKRPSLTIPSARH
jgi:hypothetical protein